MLLDGAMFCAVESVRRSLHSSTLA